MNSRSSRERSPWPIAALRPLHRLPARRQLEHGEAALEHSARIDLGAHRDVGGDQQWSDRLLDAAAEHVDAGAIRLLDDGASLLGDGRGSSSVTFMTPLGKKMRYWTMERACRAEACEVQGRHEGDGPATRLCRLPPSGGLYVRARAGSARRSRRSGAAWPRPARAFARWAVRPRTCAVRDEFGGRAPCACRQPSSRGVLMFGTKVRPVVLPVQ